jgi:ribosome-associated protein
VKKNLIELIIEGIEDKKGNEIKLINLKKFDNVIADYFIITDATSNTQVKAISENVQKKLRDMAGEKPFGVEGEENAEWVLLDYGDVIIHIFQRPVREYYDLEGLWADAEIIEY